MELLIIRNKAKFIDFIRITYKVSPLCTVLAILLKMGASIFSIINVYATAKFIDIAILVVAKKVPLTDIIIPLLLILFINFYNSVIYHLYPLLETKIKGLLKENISKRVSDKCSLLEYDAFENKETQDLLYRCFHDSENKVLRGFNDLLTLFSLVIEVIGILSILALHVWWAALLILLFSIPLLFLAVKSGEENYDMEKELTVTERTLNHIDNILQERRFVNERNVFGYSKFYRTKFNELYEYARGERKKIKKKWYIRNKAGGLFVVFISYLIALALIPFVLSGIITLGLYISLVNSGFNLVQLISWNVTELIDSITQMCEYLNDLCELARLNDRSQDYQIKSSQEKFHFESLEFQNVSFSYPNSNIRVLNNLSFRIESGKQYAIVGANGSGKTTIIKLILGLYYDFEGEILLNDISIKKIDPLIIKKAFSVAFQNYAKYPISFYDNITIGNMNDLQKKKESKSITDLLNQMGLQDLTKKSKDGINTILGKVDDEGIDISGGEWQKIALARCMENPGEVKILDEPTASLDPISESNLYTEFKKISKNHTTILISHRLGSTKIASDILVIKNGTLAEVGTHEFLMNKKGEYYNMYTVQENRYGLKRL